MLAGSVGGLARWAVTDRHGGVSEPPYDRLNLAEHVGDDPPAVAANRARLLAALEGARGVAFMRQVHGRAVTVVAAAPGEPPECDALVTATPGLVLAALVADCVPVLLADPDAGVVAAAHAGREGVRLGVVDATLEVMAALGARATRTRAVLGPAVCPACYEVPQPLRTQVAAVAPAAHAVSRWGTPALDLRAGLAARLAGHGVEVTAVGGCTVETPQLYSFRRDGVTGRFAGLVWLADGRAA
ncbi:MAG: peptidoglycan editing factor PgeF [Actinomycetia bacterium]|nr:peptidoglycan editing factor PgeF [Actinomycetes bacterium]